MKQKQTRASFSQFLSLDYSEQIKTSLVMIHNRGLVILISMQQPILEKQGNFYPKLFTYSLPLWLNSFGMDGLLLGIVFIFCLKI